MVNRQRCFDQITETKPAQRFPFDTTPLAASSSSKTKRKAFLLEENPAMLSTDQPAVKEPHNEKENTQANLENPGIRSMNPPPQPSSQRSSGRDPRDCPQTPVGRLPLSELLANSDDSRHHLDLTPIERVLWDNSPPSSATPNSIRKGVKRKRARSSSPAPLSQSRSSKHARDHKVPVDAPALQEALKTPKASIVDDLWSRYSLKTADKRSPTTPSHVHFPHLMHSSSPARDLSSRESVGLRRAFSCIDWPTSAVKRRKLRVSSSQVGAMSDLARFDKPLDSIEKTQSRVSLLVERIHQHLAKPNPRRVFSSSDTESSTVTSSQKSPAKNAFLDPQPPAQADSVVTPLDQANLGKPCPSQQPLVLPAKDITRSDRADDSSDFDDDELDIGMIETLSGVMGGDETKAGGELPMGQFSNQARRFQTQDCQNSPAASLVKRLEPASVTNVNCLSKEMPPKLATAAPTLYHDEFDDDDDEEVTAAELEDVFAKYDTQVSFDAGPDRVNRAGKFGHLKTESILNDAYDMPHKETAMSNEVLSDDGDDFGGDSDFEQVAAEVATSQTHQEGLHTRASSDRPTQILQRYIVNSVVDGEYDSDAGSRQPEKVLSIQGEMTKLSKVIVLRQAWLDTPCIPGSYLHVVGEFDRYGQCTVDNTQNLLILYPDHLISATVVGDSFTCKRKAVLGDRVKATSDASLATLYGHMLHEIFQESLRANKWDDNWMMPTIDKVASRHLEGLFELNMEYTMALDQLKARVTDLQAWAEVFIAENPKPNAVVRDRNGAQSLMCINKLLEVEEKVWSPVFGLKGNVDATVQIQIANATDETTLTVPFELKTGKHSNAAHKAQTLLYTLLLSDRYDLDIACGILYYMQTSEISCIRTLRHELVPMIIQRNHLADYIRNKKLPPLLRNPHTCGKCFAQMPCFIYHKMMDDGNGETSGMGEKFEDLTRHLKPEHQSFFKKWDTLLTKEEKDVVLLRRELWTMESSVRERTGRCFGGLIIDPGSFHEETDAPKINRFTYKFVKQKHSPGFTFAESQLGLGEPVVVSDEKGHFALANGYVTGIQRCAIEVSIDRRLHNARAKGKNFDAERNQVFVGIMKVKEDGADCYTMTPPQPEEPVAYRLDKDELSNGMAMVRSNLIKLMEKDIFAVQALRRLIIERVAPTFKPISSAYTLGDTASQANLNVGQTAAIEKVMSAKDYALVLGMPGTGKTTTIAYIIRALVAQGKNVLLTSYTHTAVDNILLKLRKDKIGIFRVGALSKIHSEVQEFADISSRPMKTIEELKRCYSQQVVATTCLGVNHPIFSQRIFDYCIVDEASQITLPVCLGPIRMSRAFILVGDHYQLPPLVQNKEALEGGLDISLFKMLSDAHPASVTNLEHQYRMCSDIMILSNTLIYNGRLKCGTPEVANRSINIPNMPGLRKYHHTPASILSTGRVHICANPVPGICWLRDLLDPAVKACFINTDHLGRTSREVLENGARITNPAEATLTSQLVESLITTGVPDKDIGVITLYRSQLALIKQSLRHHKGVEMHTTDRFQGRDKDVIILSLVRSNETQNVGDLLKDWRRVNVALTRARTKLLVLGSRNTLVGNELLKDLVALMDSKGWVYDLPVSALEGHVFGEDGGTQSESARGSSTTMGMGLGMAAAATNTTATTTIAAARPEEEQLQRTRFAKKDKDRDRDRSIIIENDIDKENQALGAKTTTTTKKKKRIPAKQARNLDMAALLKRRPVLADIINDAS